MDIPEDQDRKIAMSQSELVLVVTAEPSDPIGYAEVFRCRVQRVLRGPDPGEAIRLTVLTSDPADLQFLLSRPPPQEIEIAFEMTGRDAPYSTMPVTGFVGADRVVWTAQDMRNSAKA